MSFWLYQLNQEWWPPTRYRMEIWEGERWSWPVRKPKLGGVEPEPGDIVVFYYAKSHGDAPGFYGWAVVLEWFMGNVDADLYFRAVAPADILKMHPWWDDEAEAVANAIRGRMAQKTLFRVPEDVEDRLCRGLKAWAMPAASRLE
jgi:hypothetical protein